MGFQTLECFVLVHILFISAVFLLHW